MVSLIKGSYCWAVSMFLSLGLELVIHFLKPTSEEHQGVRAKDWCFSWRLLWPVWIEGEGGGIEGIRVELVRPLRAVWYMESCVLMKVYILEFLDSWGLPSSLRSKIDLWVLIVLEVLKVLYIYCLGSKKGSMVH